MTVEQICKVLKLGQAKAKVFTDEAALLSLVTETLPVLDECCIIRQEAIHRRGIPDLIACYRGYFIGIELKDNEGKQSSQQCKWQQKIEAARGLYILADNVTPICEALMQIAQR